MSSYLILPWKLNPLHRSKGLAQFLLVEKLDVHHGAFCQKFKIRRVNMPSLSWRIRMNHLVDVGVEWPGNWPCPQVAVDITVFFGIISHVFCTSAGVVAGWFHLPLLVCPDYRAEFVAGLTVSSVCFRFWLCCTSSWETIHLSLTATSGLRAYRIQVFT